MLPHNHFLIAGLTITPVAITVFPEKSPVEIGEWILVGGLLSAAIDLDIIALVYLKSKKEKRLRPFRNIWEIFRKFKLFKDTITETGVLRTGMKTHLLFSILVVLLFYFYLNNYFLPAALGVISHIISDIPNLRRLVHSRET